MLQFLSPYEALKNKYVELKVLYFGKKMEELLKTNMLTTSASLFKRDMMVNLYKFYFQPNQKVFHPSTFSPSQPNTNEEN